MRDRFLRLIAATALGAAAAIALLVAVAPTPVARAAVYNRYVAVTGRDDTDCSEITLPCLTPQYAINEASPGDVVKIAAGTYSTVTTNAFTPTSAYSFTQIAFISKTLTIQGGYTLTNWTTAECSPPGCAASCAARTACRRALWRSGSWCSECSSCSGMAHPFKYPRPL